MAETYQQAEERAKTMQRYDEFVERLWTGNGAEKYDVSLTRAALGLCEEAGEVAGKIKKRFRGDLDQQSNFDAVVDELGDVLFYLVKVAHLNKATLRDVMDANIRKLSDRAERGVLKGSGDNR